MLLTFSARQRAAVVLGLLAAASACGETGTTTVASDTSGREVAPSDVEAPGVFQVTEAGLWDGRPSFGGIWVAYPEVDIDQIGQVVIRNIENGRFVTGALFRREREIPGPALQVSSEAAEALNMLAGAPALLTVTALRSAEAAPPDVSAATTVSGLQTPHGAGPVAALEPREGLEPH